MFTWHGREADCAHHLFFSGISKAVFHTIEYILCANCCFIGQRIKSPAHQVRSKSGHDLGTAIEVEDCAVNAVRLNYLKLQDEVRSCISTKPPSRISHFRDLKSGQYLTYYKPMVIIHFCL